MSESDTDQTKPIRKQFIAGAVCPSCGAMDRLTMYQNDGVKHIECVECDYKDRIGAAGESNTKSDNSYTNSDADKKKAKNVIQMIKPE